MEAQKSIRKRVLAEITEEQPPINTLSTIVQSGRKGFVSHNAFGTRTNTIL
jgi:hypothetical protein